MLTILHTARQDLNPLAGSSLLVTHGTVPHHPRGTVDLLDGSPTTRRSQQASRQADRDVPCGLLILYLMLLICGFLR